MLCLGLGFTGFISLHSIDAALLREIFPQRKSQGEVVAEQDL